MPPPSTVELARKKPYGLRLHPPPAPPTLLRSSITIKAFSTREPPTTSSTLRKTLIGSHILTSVTIEGGGGRGPREKLFSSLREVEKGRREHLW
ncbi:unnamed protein product [Lactuca saligna]|uniref:Uncharacterized protein n=1 Tax=Lactuca saligna TaxID=75948 RepID=A0AA36EAH5_LACSI|nr:unnamed protein product [Lactuca saligna]